MVVSCWAASVNLYNVLLSQMLGVFLVGALDELYRLFHAFEICFVLLSLLAGFAQGFKKSALFCWKTSLEQRIHKSGASRNMGAFFLEKNP